MAEKQHTQTRPEDHVPVPLIVSDSPERARLIVGYHNTLLEVIHLIGERVDEELQVCIPDLLSITHELAQILQRGVEGILGIYDDVAAHGPCCCPSLQERKAHPERAGQEEAGTTYIDTPARTRQVASLSVSLMHCVNEISRREEDELKTYLSDLIDVAWEISLTLRGCTEATLGDDEDLPAICHRCRGERHPTH